MTVSSSQQLGFFFLSVLAGLISGAFYNLMTAVREKGKRGCVSVFADLLFWTAVGAALIGLSLRFNDGGIRGYQLLGFFCGFALHYLCLSSVTLRLARLMVTAVATVLFPVIFLARGFVLYVGYLRRKAADFASKIRHYLLRRAQRRKNHKKIQKKYKKML